MNKCDYELWNDDGNEVADCDEIATHVVVIQRPHDERAQAREVCEVHYNEMSDDIDVIYCAKLAVEDQ